MWILFVCVCVVLCVCFFSLFLFLSEGCYKNDKRDVVKEDLKEWYY